MSIISIVTQPATNAIKAAYRPVILIVRAKRTDSNPVPPVVYCDVYINGTYYKTIHKTQYNVLNSTDSDWQFDIQDPCQEALKQSLAVNGQSIYVVQPTIMTTVTCKFRSSGFDSDGFIVAEDTAPVQQTGTTAPSAGTGTASHTFYIINSVLQHEQNQDILTHLRYYKADRGTWGTDMYPLTHRPFSYNVCRDSTDVFPLLVLDTLGIKNLTVYFYYDNSTAYNSYHVYEAIMAGGIYYVPNGIKNLRGLSFTNFPIDWDRVTKYIVQVEDSLGNPKATWLNIVCDCDCDEGIRIHFLNNLGTYDSIGFPKPKIAREPISEAYQNPLSYPLTKPDTGIERFNVKSNETYEAVLKCHEEDMPWLMECNDSPKAFMEWKAIEGQEDSYLPIVILDTKQERLKNDLEYEYKFTIQFKLSNEFQTVRN